MVQASYHKRYDPNYERGVALMQGTDRRRLLHLRCVIGPNAHYVNDFWPGWRYNDAPAAPSLKNKLRHELGDDMSDSVIAAYMLMGGLSTHTFSIFRGLYLRCRQFTAAISAPTAAPTRRCWKRAMASA